MQSILVYDPPMCRPTGICDTDIDPDAESFTAMLAQFRKGGVEIERYDHSLHPKAFAQNATVRVLLERMGTDVLPVIFWDGKVQLTGRYPTKNERLEWFRAAFPHEGEAAA